MFIHLNNHSDYSLKKSISSVTEIVERAVELQQDAIAITDYGNLFCTPEFAQLCKEKNIKAIHGCEFALVQNRLEKNNDELSYLILLCMNDLGFFNLKQLSTNAYIEGFYYFPRIDFDLLNNFHEGLIAIIPQNNSRVTELLELGKKQAAIDETKKLQSIFDDRLYLEIQNHGLTSENILNAQIQEISTETSIPLVAGNDCQYIYQQDSKLHEVFINTDQKEGGSRKALPNDQYYIKDRKEMEMYLQNFIPALDNTVEIAKKCEFILTLPGPQLPSFPLPENFTDDKEYLRHITLEGLKTRYEVISPEIQERVDYELQVITSTGYSGYFLIVWDIIAYAIKSQIPVGLGRGSVAGSLVAYALGITGVDPLKYGLLFERFLNPDRISMPDIDSDFCVDRRQDIIDYIKDKYGHDHVGQIITFSQLKPRGTVRDVARSLDLPLEEIDTIAKLIPFQSKNLQQAYELEPELRTYLENPKYTTLMKMSERLAGRNRHASLHAAGVVIGANPLIHYVPLYKDPKTGSTSTQYSMEYLEDSGLVKMDILGLRTLTIIDNAVKLIKKDFKEFSIEDIPEDDKEVFEMLGRGESLSVFQFESSGLQRVLIKAQPTTIEDLVAINALYRPGPMVNIDSFVERKHGREKVTYLSEKMEPILKETYGIIIYQEQVMQIARVLANYTMAEADWLRKVMGKKIAGEMEKQFPKFVEGAMANGISKDVAIDIFENQLTPFAHYGFNKSHSVCYALLAYQTAYLKVHYPFCYLTSCINANAHKPDELEKQLKVCKMMNITILPPNVNVSEYEFIIENDAIRYGLIGIKSMSDDFKHHIPSERKKNGKYKSVMDCLERLPSSNSINNFLKTAIAAGMFDSLEPQRELLFANIDALANEASERIKANKSNTTLLFTEEEESNNLLSKTPTAEDIHELIQEERESLGMFLVKHPLDTHKDLWEKTTTVNINATKLLQLPVFDAKNPQTYYLIGYIDKFQVRITKSKTKKIYSGIIEDYNGQIEFSIFKNINEEILYLNDRTVYGIAGYIQNNSEEYNTNFRVQTILSPQDMYSLKSRQDSSAISIFDAENLIYELLHIDIKQNVTKAELNDLHTVLAKFFGSSRVVVHISNIGNDKESISLPPGFTVDAKNQDLQEQLRMHPAVQNIWF